MFYAKSFIVSDLTFRLLIHFQFVFMYNVRDKCQKKKPNQEKKKKAEDLNSHFSKGDTWMVKNH